LGRSIAYIRYVRRAAMSFLERVAMLKVVAESWSSLLLLKEVIAPLFLFFAWCAFLGLLLSRMLIPNLLTISLDLCEKSFLLWCFPPGVL